MTAYYRLNEPDVSAELFDDEVLAINLSNGHYFSIRGSGAIIWKALMAGATEEDAARLLRQMHPDTSADIGADVAVFVADIVGAGLIVAGADVPAEAGPLQEAAPSVNPYIKPEYESHTDMQDLLLIDPIHDVDVKMGWPLLAEPDATEKVAQ